MIFALAITLAFSSVGCSIAEGTETSNERSTPKIFNKDIYEFIDSDTGVHYWIYSHASGYSGMGGMTPRLNSDGSIMCDK